MWTGGDLSSSLILLLFYSTLWVVRHRCLCCSNHDHRAMEICLLSSFIPPPFPLFLEPSFLSPLSYCSSSNQSPNPHPDEASELRRHWKPAQETSTQIKCEQKTELNEKLMFRKGEGMEEKNEAELEAPEANRQREHERKRVVWKKVEEEGGENGKERKFPSVHLPSNYGSNFLILILSLSLSFAWCIIHLMVRFNNWLRLSMTTYTFKFSCITSHQSLRNTQKRREGPLVFSSSPHLTSKSVSESAKNDHQLLYCVEEKKREWIQRRTSEEEDKSTLGEDENRIETRVPNHVINARKRERNSGGRGSRRVEGADKRNIRRLKGGEEDDGDDDSDH